MDVSGPSIDGKKQAAVGMGALGIRTGAGDRPREGGRMAGMV